MMTGNSEKKRDKGMAGRAVNKVLDRFVGKLDEKDRLAAAKRVAKVHRANPDTTREELCRLLIQRKCRRAAVVGAVTAAPATIPGVGTLTSLVLGSSVDLALTSGLQAELVLEIAAVHEIEMTPGEERAAIMAIVGLGAGANHLLETTGRKLAIMASERMASKAVARSIPVIGIGAAAGTNTLTTYVIGRRAISYFSLGSQRMEDWGEAIRAASGVDERVLVGWMSEAGESARSLIGDGLRGTRKAAITIVAATGELALRVGSGFERVKTVLDRGLASLRGDKEKRDSEGGKVTEIPPLPLASGNDVEKKIDS